MIIQKLFLIFVLLTSMGLIGCTHDTAPQTPQQKMCAALKRQMIYTARSNSADASYAASSQRQDLAERYEEYGCN